MQALQILMPMGGLGSRFSSAGYTTPKALLEVDGKPMFMKALDSFNEISDAQYIFVVRQEHDEQYGLVAAIQTQLPNAKIALLDHDTAGAVETCLIAKDLIDDQMPIAVADCDIYFQSKEYFAKARADNCPDGMLLTFTSDDPRYSYVEVDTTGVVLRTAEKVVISNNAILGGYFFNTGALFKDVASAFVSQPLPNNLKEYFMSHLFNLLLERGATIAIAHTDEMHNFGTPEELNAYLGRVPHV